MLPYDVTVRPTVKPDLWEVVSFSPFFRGIGPDPGFISDGASIPDIVRLGGFRPGGAKFAAAVWHDWVCSFKIGLWRDAHRGFRDICLANGEDPILTNTMYNMVKAFGPRW